MRQATDADDHADETRLGPLRERAYAAREARIRIADDALAKLNTALDAIGTPATRGSSSPVRRVRLRDARRLAPEPGRTRRIHGEYATRDAIHRHTDQRCGWRGRTALGYGRNECGGERRTDRAGHDGDPRPCRQWDGADGRGERDTVARPPGARGDSRLRPARRNLRRGATAPALSVIPIDPQST